MRGFGLAAALALGLAMMLGGCGSQPSLPWCADINYQGRSLDCSYRSFEQCQATIAGLGGSCVPNPRGPGRDRPRRPA
jgi:hypothetical protein